MFKSKAHAAYMNSAMKGGDIKPSEEPASLPEHVKKLAHGGYACAHCGGEVGDDGMFGGTEESDEDNTPQGDELDEQTHRALFSMALKRRKS